MESWRVRAGFLLCAVALALAVVLLPGSRSASAQAGDISLIKANFVSGEFATHYTVDVTGFGPTYTASWTLELQCVDPGCPADPPGTESNPKPNVDEGCNNNGVGKNAPFVQTLQTGETPKFVWHHPSASQDPSGTYHCDHAKEGSPGRGHQGLITVVVSDDHTACTATYKGTVNDTPTDLQDGWATKNCQAKGSGSAPKCDLYLVKRMTSVGRHVFGFAPGIHQMGDREYAVAEDVEVEFRIELLIIGDCPKLHLRDVLPADFQASSAQSELHGVTLPPAGFDKLSNGREQVSLTVPPGHYNYGTLVELTVRGTFTKLRKHTNQASTDPVTEVSKTITVEVVTLEKVRQLKANASGVSGQVEGVDAKKGSAHGSTAAARDRSVALSKPKRVDVAVRRLDKSKRRCLWLRNKRARFKTTKKTRGACDRPVWLRARGTKRWSLRFRRRLPRGRYLAEARVTDVAGVTSDPARARRRFKVR